MNIPLIKQMIESGYISSRKHPYNELWILNYTPAAQYESMWNEATIMCRGLIVDDQWNIVGRPLKKFFTIDQLTSIRNKVHHLYGRKFKKIFDERFISMEKIDGSLGIVFQNPFTKHWEVATRGSFASYQAEEANLILQDKYAHIDWVPGNTYLVEIVLPENRIVVDYGDMRDLILLAVIDNATGLDNWDEWDHINQKMPFAKLHRINTFEELEKAPPRDNAEGFVLIFQDGFRLKFKYEEYKRLHYIMTGITDKAIWKSLAEGKPFDLRDVPDEFYQQIKQKEKAFQDLYDIIEADVRTKLEMVTKNQSWTRKQLAQAIKWYQYKHIIFAMVDDHNYEQMIWQLVKPTGGNNV